MSDWVTWSEARAVFGLLDELNQLAHDTLAWRRHALTELGRLVDAQVGLSGEAPEGDLLRGDQHVGCVDLGWATDSDRRVWMRACERIEPNLDPSDAAIATLAGRSFTRRRQELAADRAWYRSPMFNDHYGPARIDHYVLSACHVPEYGLVHYLFLFKERSKRPFSDREQALVGNFHRELGQRWRAAGRTALPRRLQQTLALLQVGYSEKEIAAKLDISAHTVHVYCKSLHRRLGAHSRAELLARARSLPRAPQFLLSHR